MHIASTTAAGGGLATVGIRRLRTSKTYIYTGGPSSEARRDWSTHNILRQNTLVIADRIRVHVLINVYPRLSRVDRPTR